MKTRTFILVITVLFPVMGFAAFVLLSKQIAPERQAKLLISEKATLSKNIAPREANASDSERAINTPSGLKVIYPKSNNRQSPLGINANEAFEQDASIPFIDLFRVATPFHENIRCRAQDKPCLTSAEVEYDKNGWPKKLNGGQAGVFFLRNVALAAFPKGLYDVLYDGEGELEFKQNAELVSRHAGNDKIKLSARSDGFMTAVLIIKKSNPDNPIRNIRILMPGGICQNNPYQHVASASDCSSDAPFMSFKKEHKAIVFNPDYLNFMKDFSLIRFMPMSGITRNKDKHWGQRPHLEEATWGGIYGSRGVPLEVQVDLANRLNADPWLNVPHGADDDYMTRFAQYVYDHLSKNLTPHIEYTNEAWNATFIHNEHMQKMGLKEGLDKNALRAGYFYYAKRSLEYFKIWEGIYGGHDRFVRIIGGWDTRPDISGVILAYKDTYKQVDALAIAPYVGGNLRGFRASKTVDEIFHLLTDEKSYRSLPKVLDEISKQADLAKKFGVHLIAYEGGQGLVDWATKKPDQHPNPLFFGANRDERMAKLYLQIYQQWKKRGGDMFVSFSAPRSCNWNGCWGLKEHIRQDLDKAPKLRASLDYIGSTKRWWDYAKEKNKAKSANIQHYLKVKGGKEPRIVTRPAKKPEHNFRLETPRALYMQLEGEEWDKRDLSAKWQVKWNKESLFLNVKVYDKEEKSDSDDPRQDDSIEFFIDGDNSRNAKYDGKNDFHFVFPRDQSKVSLGINSPSGVGSDLPFTIVKKYDGYELHVEIPWKMIGVTPKVANKIGFDVIVNDDDDGGDRDARIAWATDSLKVDRNPRKFGVVLISGR
ncbi:MAG: hypothetical protein KAH22_00100 [Thiotrichaceae bacterium]|nr:hypothetical protein [Thiotrichaceae bacterium]